MQYETMADPFTYQPQHRQWLRTVFLRATIIEKEPTETVCRVLNIARSTGYRWRRLFLSGNEGGLIDRRFGPAVVMEGIRKSPGEKEDNDEQ